MLQGWGLVGVLLVALFKLTLAGWSVLEPVNH